MSRFEEAVAHDLAAAGAPRPLEHVRRRARRQRARWVATSVVPVLAIVTALAIIVTNDPHRGVGVSTASSLSTTAPTTSSAPTAAPTTMLPPAIAALPVANVETFRNLDRVMRQARDYDASDGHVDYGEIVATTHDKLFALFGGRPQDTHATYLVRLVGTFTCNACSVPPGAKAPHGNEIMFTVTLPQPTPLDDGFEVGSRALDLSTFGTVYRLPLEVTAQIALPAHTMRAGSTMHAHVIVENDTGVPVRIGGCGQLFRVVLGNAKVKPDDVAPACLQLFMIPTGSSSYPVTITATHMACTGTPQAGIATCLPNGQQPPLPTGAYHLYVFGAGSAVKLPPLQTIDVTP
jgi:hypothetical protein